MIFSDSKLVEIFCDCDDFCKILEAWEKGKMLRWGEKRTRACFERDHVHHDCLSPFRDEML